jgi:DNA-binding MarR family transcriptional regulator
MVSTGQSMDRQAVSIEGVATLIEQTARLLHSAGHAEGLYPAQWTALRYFSETQPNAHTMAGLAKYQDMCLGPVARTVRTLIEKGLLERHPNPRNRRADLIEVSPAGRRMLEQDPRNAIVTVLRSLPPNSQLALADGMTLLLAGLHAERRERIANAGDDLSEAPAR